MFFGTFRRTSHKCFERLEEFEIVDKVTEIKADLADYGSIQTAIKQSEPDEIYNLGAQSFVGASFQQPILTSDITGLGVLRVLEGIRENVPDAKFYQASSSEMFGDYQGIKNEKSPFIPRSPYGAAKVFAHHMTNHYREAYDIFACCGILFNHESPLRGLEFVTRKITWSLAKIKLKTQEKLHLGNISAKRDWGFAGDYVEAMWMMLQQKTPDDYVIATGESHSVEEFLTIASEYAGLGDWHNFVEIDKSMMRPTDIKELVGDASKAKEKIGWSAKTSFEELVKKMVDHDIEYHKSHPLSF
ncbi:putative GDP-mannose 4,6-dehydratase [Candidatus Nitrosopumilus salaria BD31]|uniref:GDP-mannose 4,6-dehydratase n=1 Tax=Candidatus Nitrosopumilus salarius BD31 TaxID=859350 RepID=I3D598_9ARCH|nr:GDP-mannose 4,6-dehydratase [Candidatus Nitrosopumilus salaria]EIJ66891.1 putative GDP-mannose 4,6-dehydratase [Candidatus Nitrosopumilus salaria BD31]